MTVNDSTRKPHDNDHAHENDADTLTVEETQTKTPSMYKVLLLNDDFTPMDFVVHVLKKFFHKDEDAATKIMLQVHHDGFGIAGIYTYEVAETKVSLVNSYAQSKNHPLRSTLETE
ncbi:MAG: ATP-dependent Clp protease adapter ClpS [Bdellovibrionales bacterium]